MKKLTILLLVLTLTITAIAQKNFEVMTKKPTPGSVITIEYMPRNTALQGIKDFEATAYLLEGKLPLAKTITLKQEGGIFRGTVKTNDSTKAVFFTFAKDDKRDNNNEEGYYTVLYDKAGKEVAGANIALASVFGNYGGIWQQKTSLEKTTEFYKNEFEANPAAANKYVSDYITYLSLAKDEAGKELFKQELERILASKDLAEADMNRIRFIYERQFKDKEKAEAIYAQLKERFPNGNWKQEEAFTTFNKQKTLAEKEKAYQDFVAKFGPFHKDNAGYPNSMANTLARAYADSGNYELARKYTSLIKHNNMMKANVYNSIAWKLSGEGVNNKPINAKVGTEFSLQSLAVVNEEKKTMTSKPSFYTDEQYRKNLENSYHLFADTYATLLYHNGDYAQAYEIEKKAVENFKRNNVDMNEAFTMLIEKVKGPKEAQAELEKFFEDGKYSKGMKEQLQRIYTSAGNTEAQWTSYVSNLEELAFNKLKAEVAKKMIKMPAPQFALKDMSGKEVALSSLKGKVVVVDFWATWCGPCIASFPAMQTAVNKYKDNKDVVFLFVDTWENDSDRVQKVTDFIAKNKYDFQVLYDDPKTADGNEFVVVEKFEVEGIPTKFVIDRDSNIRFKSVGYNASPDAAVAELSAMIEMANADSGNAQKKAF